LQAKLVGEKLKG